MQHQTFEDPLEPIPYKLPARELAAPSPRDPHHAFAGKHPSSWGLDLFYVNFSAPGRYSQTHINILVRDYLGCLLYYKSALSLATKQAPRIFLARDAMLSNPELYLARVLHALNPHGSQRGPFPPNASLAAVVSTLNYFMVATKASTAEGESHVIERLNSSSYWPTDEDVCALLNKQPSLAGILPVVSIAGKIARLMDGLEADVEAFCRKRGWFVDALNRTKHAPYELQVNAIDPVFTRSQFEAEARRDATAPPLQSRESYAVPSLVSKKRPLSQTDFGMEQPPIKRLCISPL